MGNEIKIDNLKATFKQDLDSEGDKLVLTIQFNNELKSLLNEVCLDEVVSFEKSFGFEDEEGRRVYTPFQRQKVKRIIYSGISDDWKDILFTTDLYKKGKISLDFANIRMIEDFKYSFKNSLRKLVEIWGSVTLTQEILFKVTQD